MQACSACALIDTAVEQERANAITGHARCDLFPGVRPENFEVNWSVMR